jgi:hypothetical protein
MHQCRGSIRTLAWRTLKVTPEVLSLVIGQFSVPLPSGSIVVGTRVYNGVIWDVVRKVEIPRITVKGKLQNSRSWQLKLVAQCLYVRSNDTQIFDDEWETTQFVPNRFKKERARPLYPLSRLSRWCACRNVPRGREPAEVIHTNCIHVSKQGAQAINRPAVTGCAKSIPVVNGIAPVGPGR